MTHAADATAAATAANSSDAAATPAHTLTVAVLTYRRPQVLSVGLALMLEHARALTLDAQRDVHADVLVIDNDPAGSAASVVADLAAPDVRYVQEKVPGISAARNRALDETTSRDLLAFIDDDEHPQPGWLTALFDTWVAYDHPAAVVGRVVSRFDDDLDPWVAAGEFWRRRRMPTGTQVAMAAAGNLTVDLGQIRRIGVRFSARLGLSGGEDSLFTRQIVRAGGRLVWCDESVAFDFVEPARLTREWLLARARSHGNSYGVVELAMSAPGRERAVWRARLVGKGSAVAATGYARWAYGAARNRLADRARGEWMTHRGRGMIDAARGVVHQEYARASPPGGEDQSVLARLRRRLPSTSA